MWYAVGAYFVLGAVGAMLWILDNHCFPVCPACGHNQYTRRRLFSPIIRCELHSTFHRRSFLHTR